MQLNPLELNGILECAAVPFTNKTSLFEVHKQVSHTPEQLAYLPKQSSSTRLAYFRNKPLSLLRIGCIVHITPVHRGHLRKTTKTNKLQNHLASLPFSLASPHSLWGRQFRTKTSGLTYHWHPPLRFRLCHQPVTLVPWTACLSGHSSSH